MQPLSLFLCFYALTGLAKLCEAEPMMDPQNIIVEEAEEESREEEEENREEEVDKKKVLLSTDDICAILPKVSTLTERCIREFLAGKNIKEINKRINHVAPGGTFAIMILDEFGQPRPSITEQEALSVLQCLQQMGLNVMEIGIYGYTPLHRAASTGSLSIVHYLLEQGANPNATTRARYGMLNTGSPLMESIYSKNLPTVQYLVQRGADINLSTESYHEGKNVPPLYAALYSPKCFKVAQYLLQQGAIITKKTKKRMKKIVKNGIAKDDCGTFTKEQRQIIQSYIPEEK